MQNTDFQIRLTIQLPQWPLCRVSRHYFPTPEDLLVTVCDGLAAAHREALVQGILTTNVRNRLPVFLDFYFDILSGPKERKPRDERVYTALYAMATTSKKVRQRLTSHAGELETAIVHEIQIAYPKMPNTACAELGYLFMTLMYGHWRMVGTFGYSEERNVVARDAMDRLIASYTQRYDDPNDPEPPLSEI